MTARLTIERARPGMRVVCVEPWPPLKYMQTYTVMAAYDAEAIEVFEHPGLTFKSRRFVPADDLPTLAALLAERAPEFLAAVREWHREWGDCLHDETDAALATAIERAGLIAQEPRTPFHLTPQQFQEMHNAG